MLSSVTFPSVILSAFACLAYLLIEFRDRAIGTTKRKDPLFQEVRGLPLLGNLLHIIFNNPRNLEDGTNMSFKFRPGYSITLPGMRIIDVSKPEWLEYVQKDNFENYQKGYRFQEAMSELFGPSITLLDGEAWKKSRFAFSRVFHVDAFKNIIEPATNQSLDGVLRFFEVACAENRSIDFCSLFDRYTLNAFTNMTFGRALGLFGEEAAEEGEPKIDRKALVSPEVFSEAFQFAQKQVDFRMNVMTGWALIEKLNRKVGMKMQSSCRIVHEFASILIDEKLAQITCEDDITGICHQDFMGGIMAAHLQRKHHVDREQLKFTGLAFLLAGRDATSQSLSWCFFHLLMNKDIIARIRKEISEILSHEERVTFQNYKQFVVTQASVLETLRLHPSVPKNLLFAVAADQIPGGPAIEEGDAVTWSAWQMGRDPEIWGPDCGQFKPDRWISEAEKIQTFPDFKFHAFNAGPRACVGRRLAILTCVMTIVEFLRRFDIEFAEGWLENVPKSEELTGIKTDYPTPMYEPSVTLPMKFPMMISMKPRVD